MLRQRLGGIPAVRDQAADFFQGPEMSVVLGGRDGVAHAIWLPAKVMSVRKKSSAHARSMLILELISVTPGTLAHGEIGAVRRLSRRRQHSMKAGQRVVPDKNVPNPCEATFVSDSLVVSPLGVGS